MDEKAEKSKKIVFKLITLIVLILVVCLVFCIKNGVLLPDNERFAKEYTQVSKDNIYKYSTKFEILEAFESKSAIVFLGFPTCKWCQGYVEQLNNIAIENGMTEIYYYNIKKDRQRETDFYKSIVEITKDYLELDEEGNPRIYVPDTYFIKNGEIIGHNNDVENIDELTNLVSQVAKVQCSDNEKGC